MSSGPNWRQPQALTLFGMFGGLNLGNEATLEAIVQTLRRETPEINFSCICVYPAAVQDRYGVPGWPIVPPGFKSIAARALNRALLRIPSHLKTLYWGYRSLREVDLLLVPGTGALDDFGSPPSGYPALILSWALASRLRGTQLILVSIGAGPATHWLSRRYFKFVLQTAAYRSYRDQNSFDFATSLGVDTRHDAVHTDLVFGLLHKEHKAAGTDGLGSVGRKTIGVGIMTYRGWRSEARAGMQQSAIYLNKMTDFVIWLLDEGYNVRLLLGEDSDRPAIDTVSAAVRQRTPDSAQDRLFFTLPTNQQSLAHQIGQTNIVVATRYHNIVCALMCQRPALSIGYAAKNDAVMADMGLSEYCQHIDDLDIPRLKQQFNALMREQQEALARMAKGAATIQMRLAKQNSIVVDLVRSNAG